MRHLLIILKILIGTLLLLNIAFWFMAHGSGHNISYQTDMKFALGSCILLGLLILAAFRGKNINGTRK
jgi:hypothetical protein